MSSELSVHDNFVYAFSVDCEGRRIVLHTVYRDREPLEWTDVVFRDVVAHHFEHVLTANILLDVEEMDLAALVRDNEPILAKSWRWGWPPVEYRGDLDLLVQLLQAASARAFLILASNGLSGWVIAGACDRVARAAAAKVE